MGHLPRFLVICVVSWGCMMQSARGESVFAWTASASAMDYSGLRRLTEAESVRKLGEFLTQNLAVEAIPKFVVTDRFSVFDEPSSADTHIPLAVLYRVYDGLNQRFAEQEDLKETIFTETLHFLLLHRTLSNLLRVWEVSISGWPAERIDGLTTVILLQTSFSEPAYVLDAAEEFLILDRTRAAFQQDRFNSELEEDEYRLKSMMCLVSGLEADSLLETIDLDEGVKAYYQNCQNQFNETQSYWLDRLNGKYLVKASVLEAMLTASNTKQDSNTK